MSARRRSFSIEYSPVCREHLAALTARQRAVVLGEVELARIGALRVYYEVDEGRRVVEIRAIGVKDRSRISIGGEEIDLS